MADELLDLVNERDEIIGDVWKSEANQNPKLIHREIAIIIYDDMGRILFQKRSKLKKVHPGIWTVTTAGHVRRSEDSLNAAHRELLEEVGFDTELTYFDKILDHLPNETHFKYWYTGKFPENAKINIQKEEVDKVLFLSPKDLEKMTKLGENGKSFKLGTHSKNMVEKFWENHS